MEKDISLQMEMEKKNPGVTILIPDKTDLTQRLYSKRQRRTLHNNKGSNPTRG